MNLVCDESVDKPVVDRLRADGHSLVYVAELSPGTDDDRVLAQGVALGALLVICDTDFGELVFRLGRASQGVVFLRLSGLSNERKAAIVSETIASHAVELVGAFTVVTPGQVRIRKS